MTRKSDSRATHVTTNLCTLFPDPVEPRRAGKFPDLVVKMPPKFQCGVHTQGNFVHMIVLSRFVQPIRQVTVEIRLACCRWVVWAAGIDSSSTKVMSVAWYASSTQ